MKKKITYFFAVLMISLLASMALAYYLPFAYRDAFDTNTKPGPLATDSAGGLYYATFDADSSRLFYVPDPIYNSQITSHVLVYSAGSAFSSGRGFQGLATYGDSVYVCGDTGATSVLKKFNRSGTSFTEDGTFAPSLSGKRYSGVAVLDSGTTVAVTYYYGCVHMLKASDGSYISGFCGCKNYQRDLTVDNVGNLYAGRNGYSDPAAVNRYVWSGSGYSFTVFNDYITTGAFSTPDIEPLQGVGYSSDLDRLFVPRRTPGDYLPPWNGPESVMVYDPASSTTIIQEIYGGPGYPDGAGDIQDVGDSAAFNDGAADILYISDTTQDVIYIFANQPIAKVEDWMLIKY